MVTSRVSYFGPHERPTLAAVVIEVDSTRDGEKLRRIVRERYDLPVLVEVDRRLSEISVWVIVPGGCPCRSGQDGVLEIRAEIDRLAMSEGIGL